MEPSSSHCFYHFLFACFGGNLERAKQLHAEHHFFQMDGNIVFVFACRNGHLETAKWLHESFAFTKEEAGVGGNAAFRHGHRDVMEWLEFTFGMTKVTIEVQTQERLFKALDKGEVGVETLMMLYSWEMKRTDIGQRKYAALP